MRQLITIAACALTIPGAALAATRNYDPGAFDAVSVAAGITVEITLGSPRSVVAENGTRDFEDLRIVVEDNVLRIGRPARSWFSFSRPERYRVRVVMPVLRSLSASSGSEVTVNGLVQGDFSVTASSGSEVDVSTISGGKVTAHASSGSDMYIGGTCLSLDIHASAGSDLDAQDLQCGQVKVQLSSGSDVTVGAITSVTGKASSGADLRVRGNATTVVQVEKSSGADVKVRNEASPAGPVPDIAVER